MCVGKGQIQRIFNFIWEEKGDGAIMSSIYREKNVINKPFIGLWVAAPLIECLLSMREA